MREIRSRIEDFRKARVEVVFLSAQKRDGFLGAGRFLRLNPLPFPLALDEDRALSRAYGVYTLFTVSGAMNVARPAAFLIDRSGRVRYRFLGSRNRRPATDVLLREAAALSPSPAAGAGEHGP